MFWILAIDRQDSKLSQGGLALPHTFLACSWIIHQPLMDTPQLEL